ncbi:helix-turn-helix domain-containing protein [Nonomuraea jabiensis]|uniref:TetR/AcrR family transcriptional regulator n=1 Tax=Nonomuraea jabiensis TaxID=882448 RepID=UPI003424794A
MEVFWRKGYAATTPRSLADALDVGKDSLHKTLGSKHALLGSRVPSPTAPARPPPCAGTGARRRRREGGTPR